MKKTILFICVFMLIITTGNTQNKKRETTSDLSKNRQDKSVRDKSLITQGQDPYLEAQKFYVRHLTIHKILKERIKDLSPAKQANQLYKELSKKYDMPPAKYSVAIMTYYLEMRKDKKYSVKGYNLLFDYEITRALFVLRPPKETLNINNANCNWAKDKVQRLEAEWMLANDAEKACRNDIVNGQFLPGLTLGDDFSLGDGFMLPNDNPAGNNCKELAEIANDIGSQLNMAINEQLCACEGVCL